MRSAKSTFQGSEGFVHQALIYGSAEDFLETAVPFVREGLAGGEPVCVRVPAATLAALREALGSEGGAVDMQAAEEWYENPARTRNKFLHWAREHGIGGRVRLLGEPQWPLGYDAGIREWARHEAIINLAFAGQAVSFICPYDARALPEPIIEHAESTHPELACGPRATVSERYADPRAYCELLAPAGPPADAPIAELEFDETGPVRRLVDREAGAAGLGELAAEDLVFAVNEVATNALVHGAPPARLRIWRTPAELMCEISDHGSATPDPLTGQLPPDRAGAGGWGLWTARMMCDAIEIGHASGTQVTVRVGLSS